MPSLEKQNLNNQQSDANKEQARFCSAIREAFSLLKKQKKGCVVIDTGFIFRTHRLVLELTENGWVLRPNNYLHPSEVIKRYPERSRRARFYRMRHAQKCWLSLV